MSQTQTKEEFEKILEQNRPYYTKFRELILENRERGGKDYEILLDYLNIRDTKLKETKGEDKELYSYIRSHRFNYLFHNEVFEALENKVRNRLKQRQSNSEIKKRYELIKERVQTWLDKQGHDKCHYYPEIFEDITDILGIKSSEDLKLPPRSEFEAGCKEYQDKLYNPKEL